MTLATYSIDGLTIILQCQLRVTSSESFSLATLSSVASSPLFLILLSCLLFRWTTHYRAFLKICLTFSTRNVSSIRLVTLNVILYRSGP